MSTPVILITGASRGLGAAITQHLLTHSTANLFLVSRSAALLSSLQCIHPTRISFLAGDLSVPGVPEDAVAKAVKAFGRLDAVVVNHAVLEPVARLENADVDRWKECFVVNFFCVVTLVKAAIPELRKARGRVVFVSSGASTTPYLAWGAYGSSKAAMNHLNSTLAAEEPEITAVAVRPGVVDTQMQTDIRKVHAAAMGSGSERFHALHKERKLLRPDQPGNVIARLALRADKSLSGRYLSWNGEELKEYQDME